MSAAAGLGGSLAAASIQELSRRVAPAYLVGVGEVPHYVAEYYGELLQLLRGACSSGGRILLLLERPFWLDGLFDRWLSGKDRDLARAFSGKEPPLCGSAGLKFFEDLRSLGSSGPGSISCRCLDLSARDPGPRCAEFGLVPPGKELAAANAELAGLLAAGRQDGFPAAREDFLFARASEAIRRENPDKVFLFAGSFHAGRRGGRPFGDGFLRPVFARLAEACGREALRLLLFPVDGTYGRLRRAADGVIIESADCGGLFGEGFRKELRSALLAAGAEKLLAETAKLEYAGGHAEEFAEFAGNHDLLLARRGVTADLRRAE